MKGLFLNGIYSALGNMKLFLLVVLAMAAVLLATGYTTVQELFVYITITAFSANAVVSLRRDADSKWNKYEITMPVRRRDIVTCKYVSYVFWVLVGAVLALAVAYAARLIHGTSGDLSSMMIIGTGISVLTGALFYPLSYVVGEKKSETVLIISIIAAIGLTVGILNVLGHYTADSAVKRLAYCVFAVIAFAASYGLALLLYRRREVA